MPSLVTSKFRNFNADQFKESLAESSPAVLYMTIGRVRAWNDDNSPPTVSDTVANTQFEHWDDLIAMKRVQSNDASFVIPRVDWTSGTVYTEYSNTNANLLSSQFYVMTSDYNVYKCLFNNAGAASVIKPTGTATTTIETADGYKWKFMYTVSAANALKFITTSYIPVQTLTADDGSTQWDVQQAAANGAIDIIDVTAGGSTFNSYNSGTFGSGGASAASASSVILASTANNTSNDLYVGSTLYLSAGIAAGEQKQIVDYVAATRTATLEGAGFSASPTNSAYNVTPRVKISGNGTGANAIAVMNTTSNTVHSVTTTSVGSNYSEATVTLSANGLSGATAVAYIAPESGHGSNPVRELGGFNVMLNTQFSQNESNTITTGNNFRKIGLLKNPVHANGTSATTSTINQSVELTLSANVAFVVDEVISGGSSGATGIVIQRFSDGDNGVVRLADVSANANFTAGETITGGTSSATTTIKTGGVSTLPLKKHKGEFLFVETRSPITRANDQLEDVKLVIQF